ncbi:PAS domain-containing sensor histidine kinase [Kriegella aquimaris]|uniref:histidine kinase n=1 Tax=Kriegella aquimaris TaxID=192904 RepID=A0A1G9X945_9FLAO|nr:PAS domain-containing protein [Kriegella aquimaris]SDM92835.1 PAS domain S-box-containing protein [Kriegella aquimaris]
MLKGSQISTISYLIKQLPKATVFVNMRSEIVYVSDKWLEEFNFSDQILSGKKIFTLLSRTSKEGRQALKACLQGEKQKSIIERSLFLASEKQYEWTYSTWYDDDENIIGAIIQSEDITHLKQTELQLEKRELLLDEISENGNIGCWEYDAVQDKINWCERTRAIHEAAPDFEPNIENGINFYKIGYSRNTISMAVDRAMRDGTPWKEKLQITTAKGNDKWVIAAGRPLFNNNKFIGLIGTFQNINEHVVSEIKTKESQQLLRTLIDNLPLNVFMKDIQSRKVLVNKHELKFCGVEHEKDIIGKDDFDFMDENSALRSQEEDRYVMTTLKPILDQEKVVTRKDGKSITFLTSKIPLMNDVDEVIGIIGFSLDISNIKQKEEELKNLINVTSLQNKKLINFAHIVSHNLRSHTANFSMLLDFLVEENDESEKETIIGMLTHASDNLLETLENLNEVVAISSNVNLEKEPVNINNKLTAIEQNLSVFLKNYDAKIINSISDDVSIQAIPAYIESIFMNFITNAVKYSSPERKPIIKLSSTSKNGYTIVSIEDNGLGIDLKKYGSKLFGMYKTFHTNKDAKGMGLYIAKNQIEAMGGKVMVCSEVGKGTIFNIYFNEKN